MSQLANFDVLDDYAVFRPTGRMSLQQAVQLVTAAIVEARQRGLRKLMVVVLGITGFDSPSLGARYFFIQEWAREAAGAVCLALVTQPAMIDRNKFGVTVAANAGLICDVFAAEDEALAWLRSIECD